jgi:hypothetical protein
MRSNIPFALILLACVPAAAGVYPDAAGQPGTTAIHKNSPDFVNWAGSHSHYQPGTGVETSWQIPAKAFGKATGDNFDILCLGNGGSVTLIFPHPVCDGPGDDFAVFENGFATFNGDFLELAFVEVSSDGANFFRFPANSLTPGPRGALGAIDPTEIDGFAGKYLLSYGTPFDLASLPPSPALDKQNVRFIRLVDIIGDGGTKDSAGRPIYDPTPTTGSGGFDLEAVGVIHQNTTAPKVLASGLTGQGFLLRWEANPGSTYQIMESTDLEFWQPAATLTAPVTATTAGILLPTGNAPAKYWKIGRM